LLSQIPEDSVYYSKAQLKTEETKTKMTQEELDKAKASIVEAQKKAQEKAQELAEKKKEDQELAEDKDKDGLTYRQELEAGTSDYDSDTDDDGIIDGSDSHPAGGGRNIPQTFSWSYGGINWTWTEAIQEDWYDYYKSKSRTSPINIEYVTKDDPFIEKISNEIEKGATDEGLSKTWLVVSFVQSLSYVSDSYTGYDEYPKYPIETFFEKNGDCEDTSYLTASILNAMNLDTVLILLPGHMAVGVWMDCDNSGTYYKWNDKCYYYVETTGEGWTAGEIPDEFRYTSANLIKIPNGETVDNVNPQYKKPCNYSSTFPGYYQDGNNFYSDSQCNNATYCLLYEDLYYKLSTKNFYWDSGCSQIVVSGCSKSTDPAGYFTDGSDYYYDSRCIQEARVCRESTYYYDRYWDGSYFYWDSYCSMRVVAGCDKSAVYPGFFFDGYDWYIDYQCIQKAYFD
jgi:hypothetical protein